MGPEDNGIRAFSMGGVEIYSHHQDDIELIYDSNDKKEIEFQPRCDTIKMEFTLSKKDCIDFLSIFKKQRLPRKEKKYIKNMLRELHGLKKIKLRYR